MAVVNRDRCISLLIDYKDYELWHVADSDRPYALFTKNAIFSIRMFRSYEAGRDYLFNLTGEYPKNAKVGDNVFYARYLDLIQRYNNLAVELNIIDSSFPASPLDWKSNSNLVSGSGQLNTFNNMLKKGLAVAQSVVSVNINNINKVLVNQWAPGTPDKKELIGLTIDKIDDNHFRIWDGQIIDNNISYNLTNDIVKNISSWSLSPETIQTLYDVPYSSPSMTSNISNGVTVQCNELGNNTYQMFNMTNVYFGRWVRGTQDTPIIINFDIGRQFRLTQYTLKADTRVNNWESPVDWTIQGSNNKSTWTVVDRRQNEDNNWGQGRVRVFDVNNNNSYRYYRMVTTRCRITSGGGMELGGFTFRGYTGRTVYRGNGTLDTGSTLIANRTYNIFLIQSPVLNATPIISLNSIPSLPSGYTQYVKIGELYTNSSALIGSVMYYNAEQVGEVIKPEHINNLDLVMTAIEKSLENYTRNKTIFEATTAGTYYFNIPSNGSYKLYFSGAGGGGGGGSWASRWKTAGGGGGSGSGFLADVYLYKGTYTIQIGAGGSGGVPQYKAGWGGGAGTVSTFKKDNVTYITCNAGFGGSGSFKKSTSWIGIRGNGGTISVNPQLIILSQSINQNGIGGGWSDAGAPSVLGINNGRGGNAPARSWGQNGYPGYCKIIYIRPYEL